MRVSIPLSLGAALAVAATGVALAAYGDPPTRKEIRKAKGPISTIAEINRESDSGIRGLVFSSEKPRELFMHISVVGLPDPQASYGFEFTKGACGADPGRSFEAFEATPTAGTIHYRGVVDTPVRRLRRSITLRTKALRVTLGGQTVGCGPVIVLRLTNEDPNP